MFTLLDLVQPETIEEAYRVLIAKKNNTVLGGCVFLRLGSKKIDTAIDLSKLNLQYIKEQADTIEIGAMTTFRELETNELLNKSFNGIVPTAVGNIIGVQFRNSVTVGASVYAKYGFSDLITALLALDTEVELHQGGRMPLREFLVKPAGQDILTKIFIKRNDRQAAYQNFRNSASDYPVLNVAVSRLAQEWTIVVGARPLGAVIATKASLELTQKKDLTISDIESIAMIAADELAFGTNLRATAAYRKALCKVLVKRAITEVLACK